VAAATTGTTTSENKRQTDNAISALARIHGLLSPAIHKQPN
jgi:hypothetical protein